MRAFLRRVLGLGAFQEPHETAFAFKTLMQIAASEIAAGGEVKAAKILKKGPDRAKVHTGLFAARVLRMRRQG